VRRISVKDNGCTFKADVESMSTGDTSEVSGSAASQPKRITGTNRSRAYRHTVQKKYLEEPE